jgi:hypothetical protein
MPESVLLNTGCVPDYVYLAALVVAGFIGWRVWLGRTRQSAG